MIRFRPPGARPGCRAAAVLVAVFFLPRVLPAAAPDSRFALIDRHACLAPKSVEKSLDRLVAYLIRPAKNDAEKTRAIFRWVAANIAYDTKAYFSGSSRTMGAAEVLNSRKGVCSGFSDLFEALCQKAGLEVAVIQGYAKGYGYRIGDRFTGRTNHSWNAVRIDGQWRLVDVTWGSGYVDESGGFVREFQEYFFFTPPEKLVFSHFPEDPAWQLLDPAVTRDAFEAFVYLKPEFFQYGIELASHRNGTVNAEDSAIVTLHAPQDVQLMADLSKADRSPEGGCTFVQKEGFTAEVRVVFPAPGAYILRLFARRKADSGKYWGILEYQVLAAGGRPGKCGFPSVYGAFYDRDAQLAGPFDGFLKAGTSHPFRIRIPGAEEALVSSADGNTGLERNGEWFTGNVRAAGGDISVYARFAGERQYDGLLKYTGY
jgi:hypothetical protein